MELIEYDCIDWIDWGGADQAGLIGPPRETPQSQGTSWESHARTAEEAESVQHN